MLLNMYYFLLKLLIKFYSIEPISKKAKRLPSSSANTPEVGVLYHLIAYQWEGEKEEGYDSSQNT